MYGIMYASALYILVYIRSAWLVATFFARRGSVFFSDLDANASDSILFAHLTRIRPEMRRVYLVNGVISTFLQSSQFTTHVCQLENLLKNIPILFKPLLKILIFRFASATRRWHLFLTAIKPINKNDKLKERKSKNFNLTENCLTTAVFLSRRQIFNLPEKRERKLNSLFLSNISYRHYVLHWSLDSLTEVILSTKRNDPDVVVESSK